MFSVIQVHVLQILEKDIQNEQERVKVKRKNFYDVFSLLFLPIPTQVLKAEIKIKEHDNKVLINANTSDWPAYN